MVKADALTTGRITLRAATRLFLASLLVKETHDMNQMSLKTAILTFAFSGVLAPHSHVLTQPQTNAKPAPKKK
jgi:hypothetical protein